MTAAAKPSEKTGLILASASPRRLQLLEQIAIIPAAVIPADIDETPHAGEKPKIYAERIAAEKATTVYREHAGHVILAADTVVACGARILPKAEDSDTAIKCLKLLSGRRHRVISGISLVLPCGKQYVKSVASVVAFKRLTDAEISGYIASGEWDGKAGGYAIQGLAASFVRFMSGSYSNIVGLPLFEVAGWLHTHLKETDKP
ncbi:Maf family protein [Kordiimonas pumila]|uniref:dTTP/UTP pyrophosphatase n=1 Tax=Kordiimonas pumila TaxID=2161677 RepID=A0ABV7D1U7_9PROT|nr:Maf family nucleotide pyrophosphatase [Kordiimonas pumila]